MNEKDTSKPVEQILVGIYRQMPITAKTLRIFEAYQMGKILAIAGLRQMHPDASKERIWKLWARNHLGRKLFNEVYGDQPDE